jgi:predicted phosphoribosyltransferase
VLFADRASAGEQLADRLAGLGVTDPVVLALPRGGVPVAAAAARRLGAPLDVVVVRKLGTPGHSELAMGALGEGGVVVANEGVISSWNITRAAFLAVQEAEELELTRRVRQLRGDRPAMPLAGRSAVLVDDGIATGATARAACEVVRAAGARHVVLAAPVGAADSLASLRDVADEVVCLQVPEPFRAVGHWYDDFRPVENVEVRRLLQR